MEKNSAIIGVDGTHGQYVESVTLLKRGHSIRFYLQKSLSLLKLTVKAVVLCVAIFLMEIGKLPKSVANGGTWNYFKGFFRRIVNATAFCVGGERLLATMQVNTSHPREVQLNLLAQILRNNAATRYGKIHKFSQITTVEKYRDSVPINDYETLECHIQEHLRGEKDVLVSGAPCYYATTSGSTGRPKFIPVTRQMEKEAHQGSARLWSYTLYKNEPLAYSGKIIVIVSPAIEGYTESGMPYGSISGQYVKNLNENIKSKYAIPYELYEVKDYEARYYCMLLLGMADENVTMLSSTNPSTLSLIAEKGNQHRADLIEDIRYGKLSHKIRLESDIRRLVESKLKPNPQRADYLLNCIADDAEFTLRPKHYWKKLVVIACWTGGNSQVFLKRMQQWYGNVKIKDLGYLASEIRGSVPLDINRSEGVLTIDENFFEFVEEGSSLTHKDSYLMVDQLQVGKRYRLFFTNRGGLYRYDINDIVEVKGFFNGTPTIDFVQKGKGVTNITGEKIYEQQVLDAVARAAAKHDVKIAYYQMQARVELSRYDLFCEFEGQAPGEEHLRSFIAEVDTVMKDTNMEYKTKRNSMRLHSMQLHVLENNSFEIFRKWRVANGIREAQIKNVPLSSDISLTTPLQVLKTVII